MTNDVDKVKWLKEKGPLPQFGQSIKVKVDRSTGDTTVALEDHMKMKAKGNSGREQTR